MSGEVSDVETEILKVEYNEMLSKYTSLLIDVIKQEKTVDGIFPLMKDGLLHGLFNKDNFKMIWDVIPSDFHEELNNRFYNDEDILQKYDKVQEMKNQEFAKKLFPIYLRDENCYKCREKVKVMRDEKCIYREKCVCGHTNPTREFKKKERNMACPKCHTPLVMTGMRRYETLSEHGFNPNQEIHPMRESWQCPKKKCLIHQSGGFYSYDGSFYGDYTREYVPMDSKYYHALHSFSEVVNKRTQKSISRNKNG